MHKGAGDQVEEGFAKPRQRNVLLWLIKLHDISAEAETEARAEATHNKFDSSEQ